MASATYLSSADLVPGHKGERLEKGTKEDVLAETASNRKNESQLRHKCQDADQGSRRRGEGQIDVVEPE